MADLKIIICDVGNAASAIVKVPAGYSMMIDGPIPYNMARPLMVRQPYSVAVPSTRGRLHPRFLRKRGLGRRWSSPCRRDGEVEKGHL